MYPQLRFAAQTVIDRSVVHSNGCIGGMLRFAGLEVVVFNSELIPGGIEGFEAFATDTANLPISESLRRLVEEQRNKRLQERRSNNPCTGLEDAT